MKIGRAITVLAALVALAACDDDGASDGTTPATTAGPTSSVTEPFDGTTIRCGPIASDEALAAFEALVELRRPDIAAISTIEVDGSDAVVRIPGRDDPSPTRILCAPATLTLHPVLEAPARSGAAPPERLEVPTVDDETLLVGPARPLASTTATVTLDQSQRWAIDLALDADGQLIFDELAAACVEGRETCPTRQLAIAIGGVVLAAPVVQQAPIPSPIRVSGVFTRDEAERIGAIASGSLAELGIVDVERPVAPTTT